MPKHCVAVGCNRSTEGGFSLHTFPKDPARKVKWSSNVERWRSDWNGPTGHSVICSLHFSRDCFESSVVLSEEMGMPPKKCILKKTAIPSLFPKAADLKTESMAWAHSSIHFEVLKASDPRISSRSAVMKRKRAVLDEQWDV